MRERARWGIVGSKGVPGAYGGFETFADQFARNVEDSKINLLIFCDVTISKKVDYPMCKRFFLPLPASGALGILYDVISIMVCIITRRDVLLLGCSGAVAVPIAKMMGLRVVTNTAGIEWGRSKWGKLARYFLKFSEAVSVNWSDAVVADNKGIADYLEKEYAITATQIAYGGDHLPYESQPRSTEASNEQDELIRSVTAKFLAIARCQPDNNIEPILDAFVGSSVRLLFVSNWHSCDYGRRILEKYSGCHNIELVEPIYDPSILGGLRSNCIAYIHGHSAGGTNPSLVEAMWGGKNCLCFENTFNRHTTKGEGLFWSDVGELQDLLSLDYTHDDLLVKALRLKDIATQEYTWSSIVEKYTNLLEKIS